MELLPIFVFSFALSLHSLFICVTAVDTITANETIRDGQTIVSAQEAFEFGFFSVPNTSQNRYLGIRYQRLASGTVAWIANRENPLKNTSGVLTLGLDGVLKLRDESTNRLVWSSNTSGPVKTPVARLSDSGNLMVTDGNDESGNYIWQSFDHPGDTFLPGSKFGRDLERGVVTNFTSWKSVDDPSKGQYIVYMDFSGLPQIYQNNEDGIQFRVGPWNGLRYTGMPSLTQNSIFSFEFLWNDREIYYTFELINSDVLTKMMLNPAGDMDWWNWIERSQKWSLFSTPTTDNCVQYALCGVYGSCDIEKTPYCGCLRGFEPKNPREWNVSDWRSGCQREIALDCGVKEGFRLYSGVKLPDTRQSWFDRNMTVEQCKVKCKNDCSCTAYTTLDIKLGTGCLIWYGELLDMRAFPQNGQDIYIRMAAAELEKDKVASNGKGKVRIIVIHMIVGFTILLGVCLLIIRRRRKLKAEGRQGLIGQENSENRMYEAQNNDLDLPMFSLSTMLAATNNFSNNNKLGEGGFGPVYKGILEEGREIAVKRLSQTSMQGAGEFKNEVIFISKLQHRNLVKIVGCCVEGEEKMLVYEYMPNKGLDTFLFNDTGSKILDWSLRFDIINGIARGLLYLHQDSRLRIIHRDLKAGNILLDSEMNPKISDFGMARSFGGNDSETNTKRVVGTYGYMSPEYAGDGIFSIKSDVFSFGVLVLEIVSGKRNRGFFHQAHRHNLLGHAWRLYMEGKALGLADASLTDSQNKSEIFRSIHVGLLCVQQSPDDRPNMSSVVLMLSSDGLLPDPKHPGFYTEGSKFGPESSSSTQTENSNKDITITLLEPR